MTPSRDDPVATPPPRPGTTGIALSRVIGGIMIVLGAFILVRLLVRGGIPVTGSVALDFAFGLFFVARGALYFWSIRRRMRG